MILMCDTYLAKLSDGKLMTFIRHHFLEGFNNFLFVMNQYMKCFAVSKFIIINILMDNIPVSAYIFVLNTFKFINLDTGSYQYF